MLRLEHISKIYPTGEVLKDVNWEVKAGDRIGLVGVNGAGKSTQLKIITGKEEPTAGTIVRAPSLKSPTCPRNLRSIRPAPCGRNFGRCSMRPTRCNPNCTTSQR